MVDKKSHIENELDNSNNVNEDIIRMDPSSESPTLDLEIQDIEGIGPTTAKKLKEAGIISVMDLAVTSADELAVEINASKDSGGSFHNGCTKVIERF